jgi:hypothetical protein
MIDVTVHVVECAFGKVRYLREMDLADADLETVIRDLVAGQFDHPHRVIAFNTAEGWAREVSEDIAREVAQRAWHDGDALSEGARSFCERHGIVLPGAVAAE